MTYQIHFEKMDWESSIPGQRYKKHAEGNRQIRLLELTPEFVEEDWCRKAHIGYVIEGVMELEFENEVLIFHDGDGYFIPGGPDHQHKARALTPIVRVVMVEDL